jgi:hypothetical protein
VFSISLHISAVRSSVRRILPWQKRSYISRARSADCGETPPMMRSLFISSLTVLPGSTRSGQ